MAPTVTDEHRCTDPDCADREPFRSAGALRLHNIAKHNANAGHCELCGTDVQNLPAHRGRMHKTDPDGGAPSEPAGAPVGAETPPLEPDTGERRPDLGEYATEPSPTPSGRRKLADRVRGKVWGAKADERPGPGGTSAYDAPTRERKPKLGARGKRESAAPILSLVWGGAGAMLQRTGADIPVGRTMQFQAEHAGGILDRLVADTWVDRLLQPLAAKKDDAEALAALLALPILVGAVERSEAAAMTLEPILRQVVEVNLVAMAPVVKARKAEARKLAAAIAEIDPELAQADDAVAAILASIFAPPPGAPPAPEPSANGVHDPAGV